MARLFISYKRGTSAVGKLLEHLRAAYHLPWFDRDEIHLGDPHWQRKIDQGLELCKGMILCITPEACTSEPIRYEVQKALELQLVIFPIILEPVESIPKALVLLGLKTADMEPHVEDFTDSRQWNENMKLLLDHLIYKGLGVTRHDIRQLRDRDNPKYVQYQTYLTGLAERIGSLSLADIIQDASQGVRLEDVYIDSPTGFAIGLVIKDWHIVDYGIDSTTPFFTDQSFLGRRKPEDFKLDRSPLDVLVGEIEAQIDTYRSEKPNARSDGKTKDGWVDFFNRWGDGDRPSFIPLRLEDFAAGQERLVVLGKPGSGKSTFVKHLVLCLVGAQIDGWVRAANLKVIPTWTHGNLTPVYVELRKFVASNYFPKGKQDKATVDDLWLYLQHEEFGVNLAEAWTEVKYDLEHGLAVLILDGLDEIPYDEGELSLRQAQLINLITTLDVRLRLHGTSSRVIVTSRPYAYEGWKLPSFESVMIRDLDKSHRLALATKLFMMTDKYSNEAHAKARMLNNQLDEQRVHSELKDRPLFLTLMVRLFLNNETEGLPTRRGALYRLSILLLLDRWTSRRSKGRTLQDILGELDTMDLYRRLAELAFDVQDKYGDKTGIAEIDYHLILKHLKPLGNRRAVDLIPYLSANAGVLISPGQDEEQDVFHFAHRSFQEYLAAFFIVENCLQSETDSFAQIRELIVSRPQVWREVGQFAGDVLTDTGRKSDLWRLLGDLIPDDPPTTIDHPTWWAAWLAAVVVEQQEIYLQTTLNRRTEQPVWDGLVDWFLRCIELGALPPAERAACGRALGLLDADTRKGISLSVEDKLPEFDWVNIPAGEFLYGDERNHDNPPYKLTLPAFKISRYLVTYRQFQAFIDATDGFWDLRWWEGLDEDYYLTLENSYALRDQRVKIWNHPCDNVDWDAAIAFCRWLSFKLTDKVYKLSEVEHWPIRLPTEFEWEKAARGSDGRRYTYGNEFDSTKNNTTESGIGQSSAVGIFPDGASPYGVLDMIGNVWEWCLTDYDNPAPDAAGEDLRVLVQRVIRGGSCLPSKDLLWASTRNFEDPRDIMGDYYGFRVVSNLFRGG